MQNKAERLGRLRFALSCLTLARNEIKRHGREFMRSGESVYDSAVQYGGSARITKAEILTVAKMNKERIRKLYSDVN